MRTAEIKPRSSLYAKMHTELRNKYGKAYKCDNDKCESKSPKRFEWALMKGRTYSINIDDYIQLCPSCHRSYDLTEEFKKRCSERMKDRLATGVIKNPQQNSGKFGGNHQAAKRIVKVDKRTHACIATYECVNDVVKDGHRPATVSMCLTGNNKTSGGFIWKYLK